MLDALFSVDSASDCRSTVADWTCGKSLLDWSWNGILFASVTPLTDCDEVALGAPRSTTVAGSDPCKTMSLLLISVFSKSALGSVEANRGVLNVAGPVVRVPKISSLMTVSPLVL